MHKKGNPPGGMASKIKCKTPQFFFKVSLGTYRKTQSGQQDMEGGAKGIFYVRYDEHGKLALDSSQLKDLAEVDLTNCFRSAESGWHSG